MQRKNTLGMSGLNVGKNSSFLPKINPNRSFHKNFTEMKKQAILDSIKKIRGPDGGRPDRLAPVEINQSV